MPVARLTPQLIEDICDALRRGCHVRTACNRVGIWEGRFNEWLKRGKGELQANVSPESQELTLHAQLYLAVTEAKGEACFSAETRLFDTEPKSWLRLGYARNRWRTSNQDIKPTFRSVG